jgi:serine/threonine protein kinase
MTLGEWLLREGIITQEQLKTALEVQQHQGKRLGHHLIDLGYLDEKVLCRFLAEHYMVPSLGEESITINPALMRIIPRKLLLEHEIIPLNRSGNTLTLVMTDPSDNEVILELSESLGLTIHALVATQSVVLKKLGQYFALEEISAQLGQTDDHQEVVAFFARMKDYQFEKLLGVGGCGMVCKCVQVALDRPVAIKTLKRQLSALPGMSERFRREGKIIARLTHPNIIQVYEQGEDNGVCFIVMQYFEGKTLDEYCQDKNIVERIGCLIPVCDALDYAYSQGVVHRDLKPANILLNDKGEVKLLDFGIAQLQTTDDERLTMAHVVMGTPKYMAPECFIGAKDVGTEADIYAMGVIAYELLTGKPCPPPPRRPPHTLNVQIPTLLSQTILKSLHQDKNKRLRSFDLFKRSLALARAHMLMGQTPGASTGSSVLMPSSAQTISQTLMSASTVLRNEPDAAATMLGPGTTFAPPQPRPASPVAPSPQSQSRPEATPVPLTPTPVPGSVPMTPPPTSATFVTPGQTPPDRPLDLKSLSSFYQIERTLRDDGIAKVLLAMHPQLGRKVILKEVSLRAVDRQVLERLAGIQHPNIGQILASPMNERKIIFIMEYIEGGSLADRQSPGLAQPEQYITWIHDMVGALNTARQRGAYHGRLHPGNVLFTFSQQIKLVDFGILGPRPNEYARFTRPDIHDPWTADLYALGILCFEILTGEHFHPAKDYAENFDTVLRNPKIESLLKVPLGRLWGIPRFGRKYENYADMFDDLRFIREKICPPSAGQPNNPAASDPHSDPAQTAWDGFRKE